MSLLKRAALTLYGVYAWLAFLVFGGTTLLLLLVLPGLNFRRRVGAIGSRMWLAAAGIRIEFKGSENIPDTPSVIVANHSSYIDGVLLKAILPARFAFVIKKEMVRVPIAGLLLRRIGAEFVDRFNRHSGAMDARRLMRAASGGGSLVFFPEGTFTHRAGIGRFHGGAFVIAARSQMPVVPLAIQGARDVLPANSIFPRPGRISIFVLPAIVAPSTVPNASIANHQRDESRAAILQALNEPDLSSDDGVATLAAERRAGSN
jgi:1-acyl-sn-glycerol-3-phosphate acyltransferase